MPDTLNIDDVVDEVLEVLEVVATVLAPDRAKGSGPGASSRPGPPHCIGGRTSRP
jgi:hypothetical protein